MATYVILNLTFMAVVWIIFRLASPLRSQAGVFTLGALLALTVVFDNLLIYCDIVGYNPDKLLGIFIGIAPIEDFFYAIFAAFLIPAVWQRLGKDHAR